MNFQKGSCPIVEGIRDASVDDETGVDTARLNEKCFCEAAGLQALWIGPDTDTDLLTNGVTKARIV